jgi:hypothetical protein
VGDRTFLILEPRLDLEKRSHRREADQRDLEPASAGTRATGERHRLGQRGCDHTIVRIATMWALVILLDEAAPGDGARRDLVDLEQEPE